MTLVSLSELHFKGSFTYPFEHQIPSTLHQSSSFTSLDVDSYVAPQIKKVPEKPAANNPYRLFQPKLIVQLALEEEINSPNFKEQELVREQTSESKTVTTPESNPIKNTKISNRKKIKAPIYVPQNLEDIHTPLDAQREIELGTIIQEAKQIVFAALQKRFPKIINQTSQTSEKLIFTIEKLTPYFEEHKQMIDVLKKNGSNTNKASISAWEKARQEFVLRNFYFVRKIARSLQMTGVPFDDLISAGYIGLHRAADRFNPESKVRFTSYAKFWILEEMHSTIHKSLYPFKSNSKEIGLRIRIRNAIKNFSNSGANHNEPTLLEISAEACLSPAIVEKTLSKYQKTVSLDKMMKPDNEDSGRLIDSIEDKNPNDIDEHIYLETIKDIITSTIQDHLEISRNNPKDPTCLSKREIEILTASFGLDESVPQSNVTIGKKLGVSSERVRQIRKKALEKLGIDPLIAELIEEYSD